MNTKTRLIIAAILATIMACTSTVFASDQPIHRDVLVPIGGGHIILLAIAIALLGERLVAETNGTSHPSL